MFPQTGLVPTLHPFRPQYKLHNMRIKKQELLILASKLIAQRYMTVSQ
jgi:hypothetical protein